MVLTIFIAAVTTAKATTINVNMYYAKYVNQLAKTSEKTKCETRNKKK